MILTQHHFETSYRPHSAVIINKLVKPSSKSHTLIHDEDDYDYPAYYLEIGEFHQNKSTHQHELTNLRPVSETSLKHLSKHLKKTAEEKTLTFKSFITPSILQVAQEGANKACIWTLTTPQRMLYFSKELNVTDGMIKLPSLLFVYNQGLRVFAIKDMATFNENTPLYKGPFHNLHTNGVCMGSAKYKCNTSYWEDWITAIENAFFNSVFTHFNDKQVVIGNLNTIFNQCITTNTPFPTEKLVQTSITLKDLKL